MVKRSKVKERSNFKKGQMAKVAASICWPWTNIKKMSTVTFLSNLWLRVKGHFHQKCYFSFKLNGMAMWLMYIHKLDTLYKSYGSRNSVGVIWSHRGQNVIFTKNAISPSDYMVWSYDLRIFISQIPSTKVMGLEIHLGSFGVTGVKRSFSPKTLFLLQITWEVHETHAYSSARYPL